MPNMVFDFLFHLIDIEGSFLHHGDDTRYDSIVVPLGWVDALMAIDDGYQGHSVAYLIV